MIDVIIFFTDVIISLIKSENFCENPIIFSEFPIFPGRNSGAFPEKAAEGIDGLISALPGDFSDRLRGILQQNFRSGQPLFREILPE